MSSKKITDADKLEIVDLYRRAGDTTASLASRYGVSNSTISRLLKTSIPEAEYEILIQQKRGSKAGIEEESSANMEEPSVLTTMAIPSQLEIEANVIQPEDSINTDLEADVSFLENNLSNIIESETSQADNSSQIVDREDLTPSTATVPDEDREPIGASLPTSNPQEDSEENNRRRVRRRSSAPITKLRTESIATASPSAARAEIDPITTASRSAALPTNNTELPTTNLPRLVVEPPMPRLPVLQEILADSKERYTKPPAPVTPPDIGLEDSDEDAEPEDVNALAAMFGEEIADNDDDEDFVEEDWDEEPESAEQQLTQDQFLTADRLHIQVTPLSKATLPRTCYIVIDKFAELIVRPLKDFADLGQISGEEIQQRTLPVFDNHRVAKRFSNQRTQRVIKVPDSRVFHKLTQHLRSKGITCLLVDGNIYSLN